ncbi:MAG: STAS domain-containing protein [Candidatus Omnitrophota bacterium]
MKSIIEYVRNHGIVLRIENILKGTDGKLFPYIKEIVESGDFIIIRLKGNIDSSTIPIFDEDLDDVIEKYLDKHVILNFEQVERVDSSTLATLIGLLDNLQKAERKLILVKINQTELDERIEISRVGTLFTVYETEEEALKHLT